MHDLVLVVVAICSIFHRPKKLTCPLTQPTHQHKLLRLGHLSNCIYHSLLKEECSTLSCYDSIARNWNLGCVLVRGHHPMGKSVIRCCLINFLGCWWLFGSAWSPPSFRLWVIGSTLLECVVKYLHDAKLSKHLGLFFISLQHPFFGYRSMMQFIESFFSFLILVSDDFFRGFNARPFRMLGESFDSKFTET